MKRRQKQKPPKLRGLAADATQHDGTGGNSAFAGTVALRHYDTLPEPKRQGAPADAWRSLCLEYDKLETQLDREISRLLRMRETVVGRHREARRVIERMEAQHT